MITLDLAPKKMIFNAIRRLFSRSAVATKAYELALSESKGPSGGKRWDCIFCKKPFAKAATQADHREPVCPIGTPELDMSYNEYVNRTFNCGVENIQILCRACHQGKSTKENRIRADMKKIKEIKAQLPDRIKLESVANLYNALPEELKKVTGKRIGLIIRIGINWFLKLPDEERVK